MLTPGRRPRLLHIPQEKLLASLSGRGLPIGGELGGLLMARKASTCV